MPASFIIGLGGWVGLIASLSLLNHSVFDGSSKLPRSLLLLGPFVGGSLGYVGSFLVSLQYDIFASMALPNVLLILCILMPILSFTTGPLFFVTAILEFATPKGISEPQETRPIAQAVPASVPASVPATLPVVILEASQSLLPPSDGTGGTEDTHTAVSEIPAVSEVPAVPTIPSSETIVSTPQGSESLSGNTSDTAESPMMLPQDDEMPSLEDIGNIAVFEPAFQISD
jgi:hypothetical protein